MVMMSKLATDTEIMEQSIADQVAFMRIAGQGYNQIAKALNINYRRVKTIAGSDECKSVMLKIKRESLELGLARSSQAMSELALPAIEVLKKALKKGSLKAAEIVIKNIAATAGTQPEHIADTSIQIIMPGVKETINVTNKETIEAEYTTGNKPRSET